MAVRMPLKWVLVGLLVGTTVVSAISEKLTTNCDWLTSDSDCVQAIDCQATGIALRVWENCEVGRELFTITNDSLSLEADCEYATETAKAVILQELLDAEDGIRRSCKLQGGYPDTIYFDSLDINENSPYPSVNTDTDPVMEMTCMENIPPPYEITKIYYSDDDLDETSSLTSELKSTEYDGIFILEELGFEEGNNRKPFSFKTNQPLDFEDRAFYKVEYSIVSIDGKGNRMTTDHTFFVYVGDEPDSAPFWTQIVPLYELDECQEEDDLFQVTAQDRDVMVDNSIRYSLEDSEYFDIDNTTGTVRKNGKIDREDLLELGISSFSLVITATEYNITTGEDGEGPNSVEQVSIVTFLDCNDETPEFNNDTYVLEMDEVTQFSGNQVLDLEIVVKDMDEGDAGVFKLETDQLSTQVEISPVEGKQTQPVTLTAVYSADYNLFDYEVRGNSSFDIQITATEKVDATHTSTAYVTITLRDVNDERPVFPSDTYPVNVAEGTTPNTNILQVEADDKDTSPEFGKPSIRYSLDASCNELNIDSETGDVTLAVDLDFEDKDASNPITCKVSARDINGTGLASTSSNIVVTIEDVVDETPQFVDSGPLQAIMENSNEGSQVDIVTVQDLDAEASISFQIVEFSCSGEGTSDSVTGWFKVSPGTPDPPNFPATVEVGSVGIDRESCSEVTLTIQATDNNTDVEYVSESFDQGTFVITILDENDEPPQVECVGGCDGISVNEDDELDDSDDEVEVVVFTVEVTDPDTADTIQLSLSEGGEFMYLSNEEVSVEAGIGEVIEVRTKPKAFIDREEQDTIEIEIIAMDSQNQTTTLQVSVAINDLNDKRPVIDTALCGGSADPIPEDDGTGSSNGTYLFTISATDADKESPHNSVVYSLLNDQIPDSKNPWTPFTINETGHVTVLLIENEKALDREQFPYWELIFRVYDNCDSSPTCKVLSSNPDCKVNITLIDVNDHDPRDLTWLPEEPMKVTDFQKENESLIYVITAKDDDEGINAELTYEVLGTYREGSGTDMGLFRAEDEITTISSCRLYATENFEGKNYTGNYIVILQAKDGGNRWTNFNISIEIEDANDEPPFFVFEGCPYESEPNVIKMVENAYKPGDTALEVKCGGPNGDTFIIDYEDADLLLGNREVIVQIDTENSTVENLGNDANSQTLLSYWSLDPPDCDDINGGCRLYLSHQIDREEGTAYNLSLKIQNTAIPKLETWATIRVVVTNEFEYDPYFCKNGNCSQLVYMYENDATVSAVFTKATDEDNNGVSPGDDQYNTVYYYIVGGDKNYFQTISEVQNEIILNQKNLPDGLDREDRDEYFLTILATNTPGSGDTDIGDDPRNDTLTLIIKVGDVNDEVPSFSDDVLFASFMASNKVNDDISTIEASDADLNETLTYQMHDDLEWFETTFIPDDPSFMLVPKDSRSVYLTLNFDPTGMTGGYCNFTISVQDKTGHVDETVVKVYIITEDYQVAMYFSNEVEEITSQSYQIESIYSDVYGFKCAIDSIVTTQSSTGENLPNKTTVYMHFIDEEKNEPVDKKIILDLSDNAETMIQLMNRLDLIGINLDSVDTYTPPTNEKNPDETIRELQILLGVVSLVLGLFVLLLVTVYWLRTNKLQRKIKVLSTNTFGSKDEGLNQMGLDMMSVPGSNYLAKEHGNHNPVFSESGGVEFKHQDAESISSGDSVLVGVEDNPEFKSYSAKDTPSSSSKGLENPSYARSIDDVSAAPPGVHGGVKGNPLLNPGGLTGDPEPSAPSNDSIYDGDSLGSHDDASVDQNINSNFSFS